MMLIITSQKTIILIIIKFDISIIGNTASGGNDESELHFSESWFHRILSHGRSNAEDLLKRNAHLGDGTFLVRPSETFVGGFSLSFHRKGEVNIAH